MKLQTQIPIKQQQPLIDYQSKVLLMGSCFVENIGEKLAYYKFQNQVNPFGIVFHPIAIEKLISKIANREFFTNKELLWHQDHWLSLAVHSNYTDSTKEGLLEVLNEKLKSSLIYIKEASHIIFTLGTAWGYQHQESGQLVANCHKLPNDAFEKQLSSTAEIITSLQKIVNAILELNSKATIVFTISPVRHLKDGFVENQRSKAHLITAVHQCMELEKSTQVRYFPSYELFMDELRDYRFYAEDMLHPNALGIQYVWERFSAVWIDPQTDKVMREVSRIQDGLAHRAFNPKSEQYLAFREKLQQKIAYLTAHYPHMQF